METKMFRKWWAAPTLLGVLPFALSVAIVLGGCSKSPAELQKKYMSLGQHYLSEGKTNEAVIEFQNLLKVNPRSPQGHYWLGKAYLKKGWTAESMIQFRTAAKEDPLLLGAHLERARYGVNSSQWTAVKPEITAILKIDPDNAEGWTFSGQRALGLGRVKEARTDLLHALSLKPGMPLALVAMGDLNRHQKHMRQARDLYRQALKNDPSNSRAWAGLGLVAQTLGRTDEARTDFHKAVRSDPDDLRSKVILANFLAQTGKTSEAIALLEAIPPKKSDLSIPVKIAEFDMVSGNTGKAIRILKPLERQKIAIPDIYYVLAKAYQTKGNAREALSMVDRLMAVGGAPPIMKVGAARIALFEGQAARARSILASIPVTPDLPFTYWQTLGQVDLALNHPTLAFRTLKSALRSYPENPILLETLVDAQTSQNHFREAIRTLLPVLRKNPHDTGAISRMGPLLARTRGVASEIAYYRNAAKENPDDPAVEVLYLLAMATNRNLPGALREADHYLSSHPSDQNVRFLLAQFNLQTGQRKRTIRLYKQILSADPKNLQVLTALARQELADRHFAKAESLYRRALLITPENGNLYTLLGESLLGENQKDVAEKAFQKALVFAPNQPTALLEVSRAELMAGKSHRALTHLGPLLKSRLPSGTKAQVMWLWGVASEENGDVKSAQKALERAVNLEPGNAVYHGSLGDFWASRSVWKKALAQYDRSLLLNRKNPLLALKRDWVRVHLAKGNPDPGYLRQVVDRALDYHRKNPGDISSGLIAGQGEILLNKPEKALVAFDSILSTDPGNQTALVEKSGILLNLGHTERARKAVVRVLTDHPDNVRANLIMASIDQKKNDLRGVASHLEIVHQIHPSWIQPALSLASADLALKRYMEAKSVALTLHETYPRLPTALYLQASAEMGLKQYRNALEDFQALLPFTKKPGPVYSLMSIAATKLGDKNLEKKYMLLAYKASPDNPFVLNNMAFYLATNTNDLPKALRFARKAEKITSLPYIQDTLGYILFRMGDYRKAEPHFRTAYAAHFRDPEFLYHMGMNEWKLGKQMPAADHLKKALGSGQLSPSERDRVRKTLSRLSVS